MDKTISPAVSVVIPCYNQGQYMREALQSVEDCPDRSLYEIIVVNDGSTDAYTIQLMSELEKEGYHVINQPNGGVAAARNTGIKTAKGKYILLLDGDNRLHPEYIYEGIRVLDSQLDVDIVYGDAEYFGTKTGRWVMGDFNLQKLLLQNYIDNCAVFRKSLWEALGGLDEARILMGAEDWDFWVRAAVRGHRFCYIPQILFDYRVLQFSLSNHAQSAKRSAERSRYMEQKHNAYLNKAFVEERLVRQVKKNKKLLVKLFLRAFFPRVLTFLIKKRRVEDSSIF